MNDDIMETKIAQLENELHQCREHEKELGDLLEKKLNELYIHYHISRTIGSLLDLQEMLRQVTGIIKKSIPFERISVFLLNEPGDKLDLVFYSGLQIDQKITLDIGQGTPGRIVESGEHIHLHDLSVFYSTFNDFIHFPEEEKRTGSYIGIALKAHNATIGAIGIDTSSKIGLTVDEMDFMAVLSYQIAAGIEKTRLFEKTQKMSQFDGLTGLYNHRMFQEKLQQEINRRGRTRRPLSLMMLDIDHFKQFNDDYGHQAGDAVLRQISAVMLHQSRSDSTDVCCRYGGEEFAIIMPDSELHHAVKVAERLRKAIENHSFSIQDRETRVTVSIGLASISGNEDLSPEGLVKKADDALYLSKKNGRNRVSYSPSENP